MPSLDWMRSELRPVVVSSHQRSGTHLTIDFIRKNFPDCRSWKFPLQGNARLYYTYGQLLRQDYISCPVKGTRYPLIKIHDDIGNVLRGENPDFPDQAKVIAQWLMEDGQALLHVARDGRAVLASYQRMRKGFDKAAWCSFSTFIRQRENGRSRVSIWADRVRSAMSMREVCVLRYEDFFTAPEEVLRTLMSVLKLPADAKSDPLPEKVRSVWAGRFDRAFRWRPEATTTLGYTGAPLENWRDVMSAEDISFFEEESEGLLHDLGYQW